MNIRTILSKHVRAAMTKANIPEQYSPVLALAKKQGFGDYQANGAMAAAKAMKTQPRALAEDIVKHLELSGLASKVDIAGPGFINIHLSNEWISKCINEVTRSSTMGVEPTKSAQTIVVDYSSPNLAKEMHVGHLRSTIIGDCIVRVLEFLGHKVERQNHVGDWGTQFGMLIAELEDQLGSGEKPELALKDLEGFYQQAKKHFDESESFANRARENVVKLQSDDTEVLALWREFRRVSLLHAKDIYEKLNVTLSEKDIYGESEYNDDLPNVVAELEQLGLAVEDNGAMVVFLEEFSNKNGDPSAVIVQKRDGGYLYSTTDLAALRYRRHTLKADRALYFSDARQSLHMNQVFTVAKKAGFVDDDDFSMEHHPFGTMLGKDGKPFKTRSGDTVKLAELLDEAVGRALASVQAKNPDLNSDEMTEVSRKVGIGAVKYADLCKTRTNDYVFNWESMLTFEGNTGPYMQYAYTRVASLFRKASIEAATFAGDIVIKEPQEQQLALKLLQFPEVVEQLANEAYPHILCTYLYEVASLYSTFYEACPILKDTVEASIKNSRLQLCKGVAQTLETGLSLLGIETMERM